MMTPIDKSLKHFKEKFDSFFKPLVKLLKRLNVDPIHLTVISTIFGLFSVFFLYLDHLLFIVFILLSIFFDKLDGTLARFTNKSTEYGRWMDYLSDSMITLLLLIKTYIFFPSISSLIY